MYFDTKPDADDGNQKLKFNSLTQIEIILEENDLCDIFQILMWDVFQGSKALHLNKEG